MTKSNEMLDRTGIAGENIRIEERRIWPERRRLSRRYAVMMAATGAIIAVLAVAMVPAGKTSAHPGNTGGDCGACHPLTSSSFLTVAGFPGTYTPGQIYTITISVADTNGWTTGENSFDLILATGSGTVAGTNQYVKNVTTTEVATNEAFNTTSRQWIVKWTAPSTGTVTVDTWAVYGSGAGKGSPYQHITTTVNTVAIPEFAGVLLPIVGTVAAIVLVAKVSRRKGQT